MIRLFAAHPTAAALLALALVVLGLLSLPRLERDTFPDYRLERIEVRIAYPGAAAEETEAGLCLAVEDALDRVTGIHRLTCTARANLAVAEIEVAHGHDTGRLLTEVKAEIDAIDTLPATAERPVVRQLDATEPVVSLALAGPMAPPALRDLAERLKTDLLDLPGVAEVTVAGFSDRQLEGALDEARLWALGLSAAAVAAAIERQSLDLPAGIVETTDRDLRLRFVDRRRTAAGLERLVLRDDATGTLRLGDVATVSERFATPEQETRFNGERAAILTIRRAKGTDALRVLAAVEAHVAALAPTLPPTVTLALTDDATSLIADRLRLLVTNAAQGFALVLLVLWAFFSARFSLAVAAALPLSLLATVFVLDLLGLSLNLISMVGLLIAVGLLIDSAIVINENIARQVEAGAGPVAAAVAGVGQVQGAVLASFLTSVAVFAPLGFLAGDIGRVLVAVPIVLIIVLAASLVVSFLVLPFFTARSLASGLANRRTHPLRRRLDAGFATFRDRVVGRLVRLAVTWRWLAVGLAAFAFTASLALLAGGTLRFQAFPDVEGDVVQARLMLAAGTPRARTEAAVDRLVAALERAEARLAPGVPAGEPLVRAVTVELGRNPDTVDQGAHLATVEADLLTSERRGVRVDAILEAWRQETGPLPDLVALAFVQPALGPAGKAIAIRLAHPDLDTLVAAGAELRTALERHAGVLDVSGDLYPGMPEIRLTLAAGAGRLGLDAAEVARQLRAAFQEVTADELPLGRQTLRVDVRHGLDWRRGLGRLDRFMLTTADGGRLPLLAVVEVEEATGQAVIPRLDGRRTTTVLADVDTRRANANQILAAVDRTLRPALEERYPGLRVTFAGQAESQAETSTSLGRVFAIGLVAMFVVLAFQFRSLVVPLIVMAAIPLSLTGVLWGHRLMGLDLSMPSMVGFVSLAGIVVNNAILLVAFIEERTEAGESTASAAAAASLERFRPILLTTATTIAGLTPLLFETSVQAQVLVPLVTSLAFGLATATILVLLLVPAAYTILDDLRPGTSPRRDAEEERGK